jgi:hypothetical protein
VIFDDVTDARCLHHRWADANFVDIGETLHTCSDIHVLSEIVDPVVERHRIARPLWTPTLRPSGREAVRLNSSSSIISMEARTAS